MGFATTKKLNYEDNDKSPSEWLQNMSQSD